MTHKEKAMKIFYEKFNCSQAVLGAYAVDYGLKWLDCLDLQKLMTDSDFINDVCMACNAGGESPHVFPADSTVYERI